MAAWRISSNVSHERRFDIVLKKKPDDFSYPDEHKPRPRKNKPRIDGAFSLSPGKIACYKTFMATPFTIGFLGAGKMATALAKGFVRAEIVFPKEIIASARSAVNRNSFARET